MPLSYQHPVVMPVFNACECTAPVCGSVIECKAGTGRTDGSGVFIQLLKYVRAIVAIDPIKFMCLTSILRSIHFIFTKNDN
ncbi:hypothetical protein A8C56_05655 [Niabella ginsenosidivorans]|uniref:Uncharacterized protein n=1 Tax=Niabella ginsenosidivorans TaxID=1176587 RepID=A0A1A9HZ51_9BACT|nr:hypothetical protein A8C56_05655 [Niabella ginsenosidivorans]